MLLTPLVGIAVMGKILAGNENAAAKERTRDIIENNLDGVLQLVERKIENMRDSLIKDTFMQSIDEDKLNQIKKQNPLAEEVFAFSSDGKLQWPSSNEAVSFYLRYNKVILDKQFIFENSDLFFKIPGVESLQDHPETYSQNNTSTFSISQLPDWGWHPWFDGPGLRLIFWQKNSNNEIIGVILSRAKVLADLIAILPEDKITFETPHNDNSPFLYSLINGMEQPIYQWGAIKTSDYTKSFISRHLPTPLSNWKISCFCPDEYFESSGRLWLYNTIAIEISLAFFIIVIAAILYREMRKTVKEASQRVNFVSQVSHELKTPLTNIRMYAELLEESISEEDQRLSGFASIIIDESRRLSRLIANILTFSRKQRNKLMIRLSSNNPDEIIRKVIENHKPSLQQLDITPTLKLNANIEFQLDQDKFEQIMGNLINNVEKYAANGKMIEIKSKIINNRLEITVADNGPGIPLNYKEKIFQPFFRISDKASDGTAGTGIGLSIARDLARLHEGDLTLIDSTKGAVFKLII